MNYRLIFLFSLMVVQLSWAEPYLAARAGLKCSVCHVNKSGGGKRTDFGVIYSQTTMPFKYVNPKKKEGFFSGKINDAISVGANFRVDQTQKLKYSHTDEFNIDTSTNLPTVYEALKSENTNISEGNLYLQVQMMPDFLTFYLDQTMASSTVNRELFGMVEFGVMDGYAKFGRMLLPYGLRLMDDQAFVRSRTGYTYGTHDMALEFGLEPGPFSFIANITETNFSTVVAIVSKHFRVGGSAGVNTEQMDKYRVGGFGTATFGRFSLIGEADLIQDKPQDLTIQKIATYLELSTLVYTGINLKVTHEFFHPDRAVAYSINGQDRITVGLEPFVAQFLQLGLFYRLNRFIPQNASANQDEIIMRAHIFF